MQQLMRLSHIAHALPEAMRQAKLTPEIPHPWEGLEQICDACERGLLPIIGYGSLMSPLSAKRTLLHSDADAMIPVQAYGARRIFNYRMPAQALLQWGSSQDPTEQAALNVQVTWRETDTVNGVLIGLDKRDLQQFRDRERGYALIAIPCRPWHDRNTSATFSLAYILSDSRANAAKEKISPVRGYLDMCREASRRFGEEFAEEFDRTSFLWDETTSLLE
ncbi:MAG: hypothetical protein RL215_427 [Planctomycetota bacterium]